MTLDASGSSWGRTGTAWILLCALLLGAGSLCYPWTERDSANAAYIGARILVGPAPYRDAWNVKGPEIDFAYALSNLFFGKSAAGLRVFDLLWQTATALLLASAASRIYKTSSVGCIAAFVYLAAYFSQNYWSWGEPDGLLSLPLAMPLLCVVCTQEKNRAQEKDRLVYWMLTGVGVGIAALFKTPWGLFGLPILAAAFAQESGMVGRFAPRLAALAAGFALPVATAGIYLVWESALADFWTTQFLLAPEYVARLRDVVSARCAIASVARPVQLPLAVIAAIGLSPLAMSVVRRKRLTMPQWLLLAWVVIYAFILVMQGAYLSYYFLPFFAPLSILCAEPIYAVWKSVREKRRSAAWLALAVVALIVPAKKIGQHYAFAAKTLRGLAKPGVWNTLGGFLNERTAAQDRIFVWGNMPVIYLYADRVSSSRF